MTNKVAIVEDDNCALVIVKEIVGQKVGMDRVLTAKDYESAVTLARQHASEIMLFIIDIKIKAKYPLYDGIVLANELSNLCSPYQPGALLVSACQDKINEARTFGFDALLKPYGVDDLYSYIDKAILHPSLLGPQHLLPTDLLAGPLTGQVCPLCS